MMVQHLGVLGLDLLEMLHYLGAMEQLVVSGFTDNHNNRIKKK
jgi:hypothetical protein